METCGLVVVDLPQYLSLDSDLGAPLSRRHESFAQRGDDGGLRSPRRWDFALRGKLGFISAVSGLCRLFLSSAPSGACVQRCAFDVGQTPSDGFGGGLSSGRDLDGHKRRSASGRRLGMKLDPRASGDWGRPQGTKSGGWRQAPCLLPLDFDFRLLNSASPAVTSFQTAAAQKGGTS